MEVDTLEEHLTLFGNNKTKNAKNADQLLGDQSETQTQAA